MYKKYGKRWVDIVVALVGLMVLSPLFLLVGLCLTTAYCGTPFFVQERPGKKGRLFRMIKFKTMHDKRDEKGVLLSNEERTTAIGRLIRNVSLDEIPQLLNVLKGDMSLVGPRPLLTEYLPLYSDTEMRRHEVRPGITGWAQVNGRNRLTWPQKFAYDVWYVDHVSFALDMKIIVKTFVKVFRSEGINASPNVTMERFTRTHLNDIKCIYTEQADMQK